MFLRLAISLYCHLHLFCFQLNSTKTWLRAQRVREYSRQGYVVVQPQRQNPCMRKRKQQLAAWSRPSPNSAEITEGITSQQLVCIEGRQAGRVLLPPTAPRPVGNQGRSVCPADPSLLHSAFNPPSLSEFFHKTPV